MMCILRAGVAKLVYAPDSKSGEVHSSCRLESDLRHQDSPIVKKRLVRFGIQISNDAKNIWPETPRRLFNARLLSKTFPPQTSRSRMLLAHRDLERVWRRESQGLEALALVWLG